jgi:hypothetical protein
MKFQTIDESTSVLDNFLPTGLSDELNSVVSREDFPWFYLDSISGMNPKGNLSDNKNDIQYGFGHILFDGEPKSSFFDYFYPVIWFIEDRYKITINELIRVRVGLTLRVDNIKSHHHVPHVDYQFPHKTLLYYINNSDGDTSFYKKTLNGHEKIDRISPVKNRAVLFDGQTPHASSTPIDNYKRLVLNINLK